MGATERRNVRVTACKTCETFHIKERSKKIPVHRSIQNLNFANPEPAV